MKCPFCQSDSTIVKDSRETERGKVVRRRRHCEECKGKFTTFERAKTFNLSVIKRSGVKRPFDPEKILKSISTALRKRNFTNYDVENIANRITFEVQSSGTEEIPTGKIGNIIMEELARVDAVGYIRFASVYKDFTTIEDFVKFINKIKK